MSLAYAERQRRHLPVLGLLLGSTEVDTAALRRADPEGFALSAAIATVITLLDVELVVLGGGFAERLGEPFRVALEAEVAERAFADTTAPIVPARLGDTGGAVGAALLVETSA